MIITQNLNYGYFRSSEVSKRLEQRMSNATARCLGPVLTQSLFATATVVRRAIGRGLAFRSVLQDFSSSNQIDSSFNGITVTEQCII